MASSELADFGNRELQRTTGYTTGQLTGGDRNRMRKTLRAFQYLLVLAVGIGNTQIVSAQERQESKKSHEIRYTMTLSTMPPAQQKCAAQLLFTFIQKNVVAAVESTLSNPDCGASSGDYTMLVRYRDENDEMQSLEYPETWRRDNDQDIESRKEYFIGDNVDLVTVRSRKLRCICDKAGAEEDAPEE